MTKSIVLIFSCVVAVSTKVLSHRGTDVSLLSNHCLNCRFFPSFEKVLLLRQHSHDASCFLHYSSALVPTDSPLRCVQLSDR